MKAAVFGEKFQELYFTNCQEDAIASSLKRLDGLSFCHVHVEAGFRTPIAIGGLVADVGIDQVATLDEREPCWVATRLAVHVVPE